MIEVQIDQREIFSIGKKAWHDISKGMEIYFSTNIKLRKGKALFWETLFLGTSQASSEISKEHDSRNLWIQFLTHYQGSLIFPEGCSMLSWEDRFKLEENLSSAK